VLLFVSEKQQPGFSKGVLQAGMPQYHTLFEKEKGEKKRRDCSGIDHIKIADWQTSSDLEECQQSHHPKPRIQSCIILPT
jgi:hypothetical protein